MYRSMAILAVEFLREGYKIRKIFWLKINSSQMKSLNFVNMCDGEVSKVPKFDFQSQFSMSKITGIFLIFFSLKNFN